MKILPKDAESFVLETMVLPTLDGKTGLRVVFIFSYSDYKKETLKRVNKVKIDDVYVNYASVEDLVIHKIISSRPRDIEDIKSVLLKNKELDESYLFRWLKVFSETLGDDLVEKFLKIKKELRI